MAGIQRLKGSRTLCWAVSKGTNIPPRRFEVYEEALEYAKELEAQFPGWCNHSTGRWINQKQWDRMSEAAHEYNEEHGRGGVRMIAEANDVNERTLYRKLKSWRSRKGLITDHMLKCEQAKKQRASK